MKQFFSQSMVLIRKIYSDRQTWLILTAIGVWVIALQNFGVFSNNKGSQSVYVVGGDIDARVRGSVDVDNTIEVRGSVGIEDMVDVNLQAINGYRNCFYNNYSRHPKDYYRIPVDD